MMVVEIGDGEGNGGLVTRKGWDGLRYLQTSWYNTIRDRHLDSFRRLYSCSGWGFVVSLDFGSFSFDAFRDSIDRGTEYMI